MSGKQSDVVEKFSIPLITEIVLKIPQISLHVPYFSLFPASLPSCNIVN